MGVKIIAFMGENWILIRWVLTRPGVLIALAIGLLLTAHLDLFLVAMTMVFVVVIRKVRPGLAERWPYFQEKPSAPYIISFMALLMSCAFLLIFKLEPVAEQIANVAYFLLVIGVGIEFVQMVRERNRIEDD
jgi:hypothetical protein